MILMVNLQFWTLGQKLYRDNDETMPIKFIAGDVFNPSFLSPVVRDGASVHVPVASLKTLTELHGRVSAIHATNFFHLFTQEKQAHLAKLLGSLLLLEPGSAIFGSQIGDPIAGTGSDKGYWAQNPETWKAIWEDALGKGRCEVRAVMREAPAWVAALGIGRYLMIWTVTVI